MAMTPERLRYVVWLLLPSSLYFLTRSLRAFLDGSPWHAAGYIALNVSLLAVAVWQRPQEADEEQPTTLKL